MNDQPKVSVIIPVYNMEKYLLECLDSVVNQTLKEIEIICVDDGSTDSSPQLLDTYQQKDSRVLVVHQKNAGVSAARNLAMDMATGSFIAFIDPDDFYPNSGTLELLYSKAIGNGALICGGSFSTYRNGVICDRFDQSNFSMRKYTFTEEGFIRFSDYQYDYGYHRFIYNRQFLKNHDIIFPPYKRFQDPPFFVRAMIAADRFYAVTDVVYRYRVGIQAAATEWPSAKLQDMIRGYIDNCNLSRQAGLCELHALLVRRFESDSNVRAVMEALRKGDMKVFTLLLELNASIDLKLLKKGDSRYEQEEVHVLRELQMLLFEYKNALEKNRELCNEADLVKASWSYRIGRFITFIPRKIRGGIRCYQEHGMKYTLRRIGEKLGLKKR